MAKQYVGIDRLSDKPCDVNEKKENLFRFRINFRAHKGGKSIFRNITATGTAEASMIRAKLMTEVQQEIKQNSPVVNGDAAPQTGFLAIWTVLESDIKAEGHALNNLVGLRSVYYRVFIDFLGKKHPQITSPAQLDLNFFLNYRNYVVNELNRPHGVREELKRLKTLLNKMRTRKFVSNDLLLDLKRLKLPEANKKKYPEISQTQMKVLMDFIRKDRPDFYGPIKFMARTGRRIEEVTLIERKDVEWDGFIPKKINIRAETTKMNREAPLAYLDEDLRQHVRLYYSLGKDHQAPNLFLNNQYNKCQQEAIRRYLDKISRQVVGVRIGSHYFRHRFCTETCRAKLPLVDIQAVCGIKDVATLLRKYCHSSQEGQASVLEKTRL